ncbi:MAG: Hsp33 family molecular chaperone HslO [Pseudomonadota bacterium]
MSTPDDHVLPFHLARSNMRGRVVRLDATLGQILEQHRYPAPVSALVAEAVVLTALIGAAVKLRWRFSLQVRGDGPVRLIATDWFAPKVEGGTAEVRAYASFDADAVAAATAQPFDLLGQGVIGVTIDQGPGMTPYQGLTPLAGGSLSACAETYFAQSEQLATRIISLSGEAQVPGSEARWRAGGMMLQQMPSDGGYIPDAPSGEDGLMSADDVAEMGDGAEDWRRVNFLAETVEAHELIGPVISPETLLTRLFHEEAASVFPAQPVAFGCTCSAERVVAAMAQYSPEDIAEMTTEDGKLTADCQFCGAHYEFDPAMLGAEAVRDTGTG